MVVVIFFGDPNPSPTTTLPTIDSDAVCVPCAPYTHGVPNAIRLRSDAVYVSCPCVGEVG